MIWRDCSNVEMLKPIIELIFIMSAMPLELETKVIRRFPYDNNCVGIPISHLLTVGSTAKCLHSVLNVKALIGAFMQEKALIGAFSVIVKSSGTLGCHQYHLNFPARTMTVTRVECVS